MFRRKVDSFMISLICFLEFAAATADALSIVEFDGMTFMMLIAIQFFFICDDQDCERAERREKCKIISVEKGAENDSRRA